MTPALMLATAATLGCGNAAEIRRIEPIDLLAAAFVARISLDARLGYEAVSPEAVSLELWYPPAPAEKLVDVSGPPSVNPRRDLRYDLRLPIFRTKP